MSTLIPGLGKRLLFLGGGGGGIFLGLTSGPPLLSLCPSFRRLGIFDGAFSLSLLVIGVEVLSFLLILDDSTVSVDLTTEEILGMFVKLNLVSSEAELLPVDVAVVVEETN